MRTRVFLVLVAIAIGGAGAGIYLAIDAQRQRRSATSDLQDAADRTDDAGSKRLETRVESLEAEVQARIADCAERTIFPRIVP